MSTPEDWSPTPPFLTRVRLKNYRSIEACDIELGSLTLLVGPNGAGKSNFLDALEFVANALENRLEHALKARGGLLEVLRRSASHPTHFVIQLNFELDGGLGSYGVEVGTQGEDRLEVKTEACWWLSPDGRQHHFWVQGGKILGTSLTSPPAVSSDRLFLANASGAPEFRKIFDALIGMGRYNPNPAHMRQDQLPDSGEILSFDGSNLPSVLGRLERTHPDLKRRVEEYLAVIVPGIERVERRVFGSRETLEFSQRVQGQGEPQRFLAASMSDGTLHALGVLVALFQGIAKGGREIRLVGIEEPESALHPAAAAVLRDALEEASEHVQVVVTSHSPELLDELKMDAATLLIVVSQDGVTKIAPLDEGSRSILRDNLFTAGELLRMDQLSPDFERIPKQLSIPEARG